MLTLKTSVSRKTPLDGRLEIPGSLADHLGMIEEPLTVQLYEGQDRAQVEEMACTCAKAAAGGSHVHYFLSSNILRALHGGSNVNIAVDVDRGLIRIDSDS